METGTSKKWNPTFPDIVTVGTAVGAVVMWFDPPGWRVGIVIWLGVVALVGFTALRHQSHPIKRGLIAGAVVLFLVFVTWRPIWESFHKDYPRAAFNWPITLTGPAPIPAEPPGMPPLHLPGPPLSKWGKAMFICQYPAQINATDTATARAQIRRNAEIYGKALGVDIILTEIPYGIRFDVTASDAQGQQLLFPNQRYTVQLEMASNGIFVTFTLDFVGGISMLSQVSLDRDSDIAKSYVMNAEELGFPSGTCRML
jgi:hypothetical protein